MLRAIAVLAAAAAARAALAAPWAEFYVAPQGSDSGAGTITNPFATLQRARQAVARINAGMQGDVAVYLRQGSYFVADGDVVLGPSDSGMNGFQVIYMSYPGETATVHGGQTISSGWTQVDPTRNLWAALNALPARQAYYNGQRLQVTTRAGSIPGKAQLTSTGYTTDDTSFLQFSRPAAIEFLYTSVGSSWTEARCRVAGISALAGGAGTNITMSQPCFANAVGRLGGQGVTFPASSANIKELLSQPGQFFQDDVEGKLYVIPPAGSSAPTSAQVVVPATTRLMVFQGSNTPGQPVQRVSNVVVANITFQYAGARAPEE